MDGTVYGDRTQLAEELRRPVSGYDGNQCSGALAPSQRDAARAGHRLLGLRSLSQRARVGRADLLREVDHLYVRRFAERLTERDRPLPVVGVHVHAPQTGASDNGNRITDRSEQLAERIQRGGVGPQQILNLELVRRRRFVANGRRR